MNEFLGKNSGKKNCYLTDFTYDELNGFFGLLIATGVFHSSRESIVDLYSDDENRSKPIYKATMARDRFKALLKYLRFDDQATRIERKKSDKLAPIRDVFEEINNSFRQMYTPGTWVTVDEHLMRYRGKCSFKQYMPRKPDRYGLKVWVLADAKTFYPYNLEIYTGKTSLKNTPEEIVLRLTSPLKSGHIVVGDNYFTSLKLSGKLLRDRNIGYLGTIRKRRREIPRNLYDTKTRSIYSSTFIYTDKHVLVSYVPKRLRNVFLLSNVHKKITIPSGLKRKSNIIIDYNKGKCGVDKLDQALKEYRCYRSTRRWPCVVFFDLIGFACLAAWTLYSIKFPQCPLVKRKNRKEFLYILSKQLCNTLILKRKMSPNFKYCSNLIKKAATTSLNLSNFPQVDESSQPVQISSDPTVNIVSSPTGIQPLIQSPIQISPLIEAQEGFLPAKLSLPLGLNPPKVVKSKTKRGRCAECSRQSDKKFSKNCYCCEHIICPEHSKLYCICITCQRDMT